MAFAYRQGGVTVRLNDALERFARAAADRAAPGALSALEANVRPVFVDAVSSWPVRTGVSKRGLEMVALVDGDRNRARVQIRNDVKYAVFVRPRNAWGGSTAWQVYVRGPMGKLTRRLVNDVQRRIVEEVERARAA